MTKIDLIEEHEARTMGSRELADYIKTMRDIRTWFQQRAAVTMRPEVKGIVAEVKRQREEIRDKYALIDPSSPNVSVELCAVQQQELMNDRRGVRDHRVRGQEKRQDVVRAGEA